MLGVLKNEKVSINLALTIRVLGELLFSNRLNEIDTANIKTR